MAISAITERSQQEKQLFDGGDRLSNNEQGGRLRRVWFDFDEDVDATGSIDDGDIILLGRIPKGVRCLGGSFDTEDFGTNIAFDFGVAALDSTGEIDSAGVSDDPDFFSSAPIDVDSAGQATFCRGITENMGYETDKELALTLEVVSSGGAVGLQAGARIVGYFEYME